MNQPVFFVALLAVGVAVVLTLAWSSLTRWKRQLDPAKRQGLEPTGGSSPTMDQVRSLAKSGQKIAAIRLYREIHHSGLKEAKDAVELLIERENSGPTAGGHC